MTQIAKPFSAAVLHRLGIRMSPRSLCICQGCDGDRGLNGLLPHALL